MSNKIQRVYHLAYFSSNTCTGVSMLSVKEKHVNHAGGELDLPSVESIDVFASDCS